MQTDDIRNSPGYFSYLLKLSQNDLFDVMARLKLEAGEKKDFEVMHRHHPQLRKVFDLAFVSHLSTSQLISHALPESLLGRIRQRQHQLFEQLMNQEEGEDISNDRSRIEFAHQQMGLHGDWYFAAFCKYLSAVLDSPLQDPGISERITDIRTMALIFKLAMFDLGIALEVYSEVEKKRFFESYISQLQVASELTGIDLQTDAPSQEAPDIKRQKLDQLVQHSLDKSPAIRQMSVVYLGIDQYQDILSSRGFETVRLILQTVEIRLRDALGENDILTHLGGEEFLFVLLNRTDSREIIDFFQQVTHILSEPIVLIDQSLHLTCSAGAASYPADGQLMEDLTRCAESAYRKARMHGADSLRFYSNSQNESLDEELKLIHDLRFAAQQGELELYYQPKVDLQQGKVAGFEALLRWHHPERGDVPPARFIPLAERSGLIVELGKWIVQEACRQIAEWRARGVQFGNVAVNISALQFHDPDFIEHLFHQVDDAGVRGEELMLEVTESVLIHDQNALTEMMHKLRPRGFRLALDDFGTGYSALSYLKSFPFDYVKIDQSFVCDLPGNQDDVLICKAIISMAHSMGIAVIAEGVENAEQGRFLAENLCEQIQGFYFSKPLNAADVELWLSVPLEIPQNMQIRSERQRTLLLVDDEPNIIAALKRLLRRDGYRIFTAGGGSEGLDILRKENIDVIISDQRMPEMSGVDFLRQARQISPDTIRIILSGYAELQYITEAVNEGAIYKYLTKPWDDDLLRKNISNTFSYKEVVDENQRLAREIQMTNNDLAKANRRLSDMLGQQQRQMASDRTSINVIQEILHHLPIPLIGMDADDGVVFRNLRADDLFHEQMEEQDAVKEPKLPQLASLLHHADEGRLTRLSLHGKHFQGYWKAMGQFSEMQGKIVVLLPEDMQVS